MERFGNASFDDIEKLIHESKNENTAKPTARWMNVYHTWVKDRREVFEIEPIKLDHILQHFLQNWKNKEDKIMILILYVQCKI